MGLRVHEFPRPLPVMPVPPLPRGVSADLRARLEAEYVQRLKERAIMDAKMDKEREESGKLGGAGLAAAGIVLLWLILDIILLWFSR